MTEPNLEDLLSAYSPEIHNLISKTCVPEIVDLSSKIVVYGYERKYADLICGIMPYKTYINLIFANGARLSDPNGLRIETRKRTRHLHIQSPDQVEVLGVRNLI